MADEKNDTPEAHAYTPGLKVKRYETVEKTRRLPIHGEVFVKEGDTVAYETIIAKTELSGDPEIVKASMILNVEPERLPNFMLKQVGDTVEEGEMIASYTALFGLIKKQIIAPKTGTIESISDISGQLILRGAPIPIEVEAYIPGKIVEVMPKEGAVIETNAAFIQGIFGIGGEEHGKVKIAVESPTDILDGDKITPEDKGMILVGGSLVTLEAIKKGAEYGVACIVSGGVRHEDLTSFTGEEVGVAITGQEELGITLIITEGFGNMVMSQSTFDLLSSFEGYDASVNGATQIRAGVLRPEIIIPHEEKEEGASEEGLSSGMVPGTPVRIIRQPYFGAFGEVVELPVNLQQLESESYVRVLKVRLADGSVVTIPRANVEIIEE
jgi:biotin carboxyl carrier protein